VSAVRYEEVIVRPLQ